MRCQTVGRSVKSRVPSSVAGSLSTLSTRADSGRFDAAVAPVADPTAQTARLCVPSHEGAEAHALNATGDRKAAGNNHANSRMT
jgi:hypothetical protein